MSFDALKDYTPQKVESGFEIIKHKALVCGVEHARIEQYKGDREDLKGESFYRYELTVLSPAEFTGRKLWKSFRLSDDNQLKKLADQMFTVGLEFKDEASLEKASEEFVKLSVNVRAWGWTPPDASEPMQLHLIKGIAKEAKVTEPAF